jgi:hypothetical protein
MLAPLFDTDILGLEAMLIASYGDGTTETQIALAIISMGSVVGAVSGIALALPQWFVVRRHVSRAGWWLSATLLGGAAIVAALLYGSAWAIQSGGFG